MNIGPDGLLYVVSVEHGKVYKIMPAITNTPVY